MIKGKHTIIYILLTAVVFLFSSAVSYAANISLTRIDVDQNPENEYSVFVKTDKKANIKTQTIGNNKLTILLKSTLPSESMEIIYDDAPDMKNVIVQKKNKNDTLILLEGANITKAQIYNNDLSSGQIKPVYSNGVLNNLFFGADNKLLITSMAGIMLVLFMMLFARPNNRRYNAVKVNNVNKQKKQARVNTLRNKNLIQSRNIPSIAYNVNGSFNSAQKYMSTPDELLVNEQYEEEEIRKAG